MKQITTILSLLFLILVSSAQNREKAFEMNQNLGRGINFGNMFEAPSETAWGNPWQPEYTKLVAEAGFNHVRIPIRWETEERSSDTFPYSISPEFLKRIEQVVDSALKNGLYAIINMHHHEELYENPDDQKERFLAQWQQISEYFSNYPDSLLFEILNEPHGNLSAEKWNNFLADALTAIRESNQERIVLIGTAEYGGLGGLSKLELPDDDNIILTVHYYNPFRFTHQGASWVDGSDDWLETEWNDTETERQVVQNEFAPLKAFAESNKIPVHIGEFGAYSAADMDSREKWTTFIARYLETQDWSWAYWEFCAGFGIYNQDSKTYYNELVNALLHNEMPEPAYYLGTAIYSSNFAETVADWSLYNNGDASSNKLNTDNKLVVSINKTSSEDWHIQLVKNNIKLEEGKKYRLSFKARSTASRAVTAYVGESSSPWATYSNYNEFYLCDTFAVHTFIFDMSTTDDLARIVFDLGASANNVTFSYVLLEEIVLEEPTSASFINNVKSEIYPNPASQLLHVANFDDFQKLTIINIQGKIVKLEALEGTHHTTDLSKLPSGIYFVILTTPMNSYTSKIIKN